MYSYTIKKELLLKKPLKSKTYKKTYKITYKILELLDMKSRASFRENYLISAINNGFVKMTYPDKPISRRQTYYKG